MELVRRSRELEFWKNRLVAPLPILDLPYDFSQKKSMSNNMSSVVFRLDVEKTIFLKSLVEFNSTSLFNLFFSFFNLTLANYSEDNDDFVDIMVCVPLLSSDKCLSSSVAVRSFIDLKKSFKENLIILSKSLEESFQNSSFSIDDLFTTKEILFGENLKSFFQASFCLVNDSTEVEIIRKEINNYAIDFSLNVLVLEDIQLSFEYNSELFKKETIQRFVECFIFLLDAFSLDKKLALKDIPCINLSQEVLLLDSWNNTSLSTKNNINIHKYFIDHAKKYPLHLAVENSNGSLSYGELDRLSDICCQNLRSLGVKNGDLVGVHITRNFNLIISILGILKTGAGYLPLDPTFPEDRINYIISNSKPKIILSEILSSVLPDFKNVFFIENILQKQVLDLLDSTLEFSINDTAYVIYTSGSTGSPKGVEISHGSVVNFLKSMNKDSLLGLQGKFLALATINFDISVFELFLPLFSGGTIFLASFEETKDSFSLNRILGEKNIKVMQATPSTWRFLISSGWKGDSRLKVFCCGEPFPKDLAEFLIPNCLEVWNGYGPTETTIYSTCKKLTFVDEVISIGRPLDNTKCFILDKFLRLKPIGGVGELFIGGIGLAKGYFNRDDLTFERFIDNPFIQGEKIYATGDLVKFTSTGEIICLGRNDGQVKIRGNRVELKEIELFLKKQENVLNALVKTFIDDETNSLEPEKYICAYVLGDVNFELLRNIIKKSLPEFMIPRFFMKIDSIPLGLSGKVDYKLLPKPNRVRPDLSVEYKAPKSSTELSIIKIWNKFLNINKIGIDDNFFDIGGNSLMAIKILADINSQFLKTMTMVNLFEFSTVKEISAYLDSDFLSEEKPALFKIENHVSEDIAIIGMTGRFPGAGNIDELWNNILNSQNNIEYFKPDLVSSLIEKELVDDENYKFVRGVFPNHDLFDCKFFGITPREAELMDPQQRKFLELAHEALELSGYNPETFPGSIGVFVGTGNSKYYKVVDQYPDKIKMVGSFNVMLGLEKDFIATRAAYKLNLKGPAISINTGCSTSLVAIIEAVKSLKLNQCDIALSGGISISGIHNSGHLFQEGGILSINNECRSFDNDATGTVFTDGGGIVVLKRLKDAQRDGDSILAVIKGVGINNDGSNKVSFTAPSVTGQKNAILMAQKDAGISADTIGFIEGHGTATPVGDPIEVEALTKAFRVTTKNKNFCYLGSIKSNIGHLTGAAGVASFIKAVKSVQTGLIPGTAHYSSPNKYLTLEESPFIISNNTNAFPEVFSLRRAGISSFGVGGTNAHIIIEEYKKNSLIEKLVDSNEECNCLFKLSAKSERQLNQLRNNLLSCLDKSEIKNWKNIAYTLDVSRTDYKFRDFFIAKDLNDLEKLKFKNFSHNELSSIPQLYFLFPGQGSHYKEMGKELYKTNSAFRESVDQCDAILRKLSLFDLKENLFGSDSEKNLLNIKFSQVAIFVIEFSLGVTFKKLGFSPAGFVGHSLGEFAAATMNGIFSLEDSLRVILKRAELIEKLPAGQMMSVGLSEEDIRFHINNFEIDIAAINGSRSCVVSGSIEAILDLQEKFNKLGIAFIELKSSHAFHSRMMKPIIKDFEDYLQSIKINLPNIPMFSTVTSNLEFELFSSPGYWLNHITDPVLFLSTIQKVISIPDVMLIEVGPSNVLSGLARKELSKHQRTKLKILNALSSDSKLEDRQFKKCLGELWMLGLCVLDKSLLYKNSEMLRVVAPTYVFEETKVWLDHKKLIPTMENKLINTNLSELKYTLKNLLEESSGLDFDGYNDDTSFLEIGMDSLFLTQVSQMLKKELKVNVSFRELMENYFSLNLLANFLSDKVILNVKSANTKPLLQQNDDSLVQDIKLEDFEKKSFKANNNYLETIIDRQLALMSQQILMLSGGISKFEPEYKLETDKKNLNIDIVQNKPKASVTNLKDAFGAQARISTERNSTFTFDQNYKINDFIKKYSEKTKMSKKFTQENRKNHSDPRVVSGFKPELKEIVYPIVVRKSKNQTLWDLDDNTYIDMTCGFGSNFFGNGNEVIKKHILNQVEEGMEIGPQHPLVSDVSNLINELTGNERTAFCNTGSEAVLGAMRIARTVTGREKIIVFNGSYHGINDEVILRGSKSGKSHPASPGINDESVSNMIVLDYGTEESLKYIRENSSNVAAILIEPVQSRRCNFQPVEFLKEVRRITLETKTCLIFDEIITGFRVHPAGVQGYFGIRADICTYGKIVGGGMPIGIVSGKAEYMDALDGGFWKYGDDSTPTVGVTYFAGTFVRHPLALAASLGALKIIKAGGISQLESLNSKAQKITDEINLFFLTENAPLEMNNFGSLMKPKWLHEVHGGELFFAILRYHGIHVFDGFPWFVNLAHTDAELAQVIQVIKVAVKTMQEFNLFSNSHYIENKSVSIDPNIFEKDGIPIPGAKLGRDEKGNPAWFLEDPKNNGEYFLLKV